MLKYFLSKQVNVNIIIQNFLNIEHKENHIGVFCVTDWLGVFKRARKNVKYPNETFKLRIGGLS